MTGHEKTGACPTAEGCSVVGPKGAPAVNHTETRHMGDLTVAVGFHAGSVRFDPARIALTISHPGTHAAYSIGLAPYQALVLSEMLVRAHAMYRLSEAPR